MNFKNIEVSDQELDRSKNSTLSLSMRREILQRSKAGYSTRKIAEEMGIKRSKVRAVLDPYYSFSSGRRNKLKDQTQAEAQSSETKRQEKEKRMSLSEQALMSEEAKKFDPEATAENCIEDLRALQEKNKYRWITRTVYRAEGKYSESTWVKYFGTFQQFRQSAGIEPTRYQGAIEKQIAKHASLDHYVKFHREKVMPHVGLFDKKRSTKREKLIAVISDVHSLMGDPYALAVFFDVVKRTQPEVINVNGDLDDGYAFNRYGVDPRLADLTNEIAWCRWFFQKLRELCPESEIDFNLGNHEWRLLRLIADASPYLKELLAEVMGLSIGDIYGVRDYEVNVNCKWDFKAFNKTDVNEEIAKNYMIYDEMFCVAHVMDRKLMVMSGTSGHTHKPRLYTSRNPVMDRVNWVTTGCMCKMDPEYVPDMDESMQGFSLFTLNTSKKLVLPEPVLIPGDQAVFAGKYYYREDLVDGYRFAD